MLDQLLKTLVSQAQGSVVENPAIPNELNQQVIGEAGKSIFDGLQGALAGGGLSQLMRLFNGGQQGQGGGIGSLLGNPIVQNIVQSFTGKLTSQYNVNPASASQIGAQLIPEVLAKFGGRVSDPQDSSIDMNGVLQSLTGGQMSGMDFNSLASRFSGDKDGDGDVDLQDIISSVSGAAGNAQASGGGGIMDMIGQLMR